MSPLEEANQEAGSGSDSQALECDSLFASGRQSCGQLFPACSPRNSDGGDTDWATVEEKILRDVSSWLSPADLRRARLVCKSWLAALATLSTKATTPPEPSTVTKWRMQLEAMVAALPCLQEVTIGSKLSSVGAQQLGILAGARQLRAISIPFGHTLQDRSLQALQPMSATLKELRIRGAASLSQRALLLLSVLGNLESLELKNCGKISWAELQEAWYMACLAYEAADTANTASALSTASNSYNVASRLGAWLPGSGRLFRTSSPSSSSMQSSLLKQKSGGGGLLACIARKSQAGSGPAATAGSAAKLGCGAIGNGRSSSGGGSQDLGAVRKYLYKKQKQKMSTAADALVAAAEEQVLVPDVTELPARQEESAVGVGANGSTSCSSTGAQPPAQAGWTISASAAPATMATSTSTLYRVGTLVWQGTTAAAAALSSSSSVARQSSAVQVALLSYLAAQEAADELYSPKYAAADAVAAGNSSSSAGGSPLGSTAGTCGNTSTQPGGSGSRFGPGRTRQLDMDKALPAMPFTKLLSLSFTCSEVTLRKPGAELAAVAALTTLTSLEMCKCKLPDSVLWRLAGLTRLKKLKLSGLWSMGDLGIGEIAKLTTLKSLALSEAMHVSALGLKLLTQLTGLTSLSVGLTQDLGPGALGRLVQDLPLLQCVEVSAACWTDVDCELLAAAAAPHHPAVVAAAVRQAPHMLWNIPAALSMSRNNSGKLQQPVALGACSSRSNSSMNLRAPSCSSMQSFGSLSNYSFSVPAAPGSSSLPHQQQQLLALKLHGCSTVGHAGMAAIKRLSALQLLVLDSCKNIHAADVISQGLLPAQLTLLSFRSMPFGNAFSGCVDAPVCSASLVKLELVSLSAAHSGQLRRILSFFPKLTELSLAGNVDLADDAMRHLTLLPKLLQLNLSGTRITSQGLEPLLYLPELRTLSLKGCNLVTDAGLRLVEVFPAVQELDLSDCAGVSERGLMAVMLGVPKLVKLDVRGCKGATRELVQCCPHFLHLRHSH